MSNFDSFRIAARQRQQMLNRRKSNVSSSMPQQPLAKHFTRLRSDKMAIMASIFGSATGASSFSAQKHRASFKCFICMA